MSGSGTVIIVSPWVPCLLGGDGQAQALLLDSAPRRGHSRATDVLRGTLGLPKPPLARNTLNSGHVQRWG